MQQAASSPPSRSLELIREAAERLGAGAPRDALRCAEEALRLAPRDPDALYFVGAAHYGCGDLGSAESRLKQAIQADGRTAAFHGTLGNVLQDRGALNEAIAQYRRAIRLKPDSAEAHNDLGTAYFARGDEARALECYQRAAQLQPSHAVAYSNLGAVYRKLGLAREARRALQREFLLRIRSFFRFKKMNHAQVQLDRGNPRLAARIAKLEPRNARSLAILGAARRELGELPEAIAAMQDAVALSPSDSRLREQLDRLLADRYLAQRDWQKLEKSPLPFHRAEALLKLGRTQEAETALREAVAADRRDLRAWIRLGDLLRLGGRLEEAEACLELAVELDEESPAALVGLGLLLRDKGRTT
ncbi:MAG: tetratricopeptide repeat protein, partial [Pseudomonadota bacterium]|nr:tetratricopeptide repeat protein [Pseudomonadota bacterium]